jgi:hypothetical protein
MGGVLPDKRNNRNIDDRMTDSLGDEQYEAQEKRARLIFIAFVFVVVFLGDYPKIVNDIKIC